MAAKSWFTQSETKRSAACFSGADSEATIAPATNGMIAVITRGKARVTRRCRRSTSEGNDLTLAEKLNDCEPRNRVIATSGVAGNLNRARGDGHLLVFRR